MQVDKGCVSVASYPITYRKLSCFCDTPKDWKILSGIIRKLNYYRDLSHQIHPSNVLGTKDLSCSDDELQKDIFDDYNIFLYIEQDTSKAIYDGALKQLFINEVVASKRKIGLLDVGPENRRITRNQNGVSINYLMEYDELNSRALISFQQAIHHDSTYQKQFKEVDYQLVRKQTNKPEASIRYEDTGARFYLTIF